MTASADALRAQVDAYLKAHRLRMGRARRDALAYVLEQSAPFDVPSLVRDLPDVDRTSVYRAVRLAVEAGVVLAIGSRRGVAVYAIAGAAPRCPCCGALLDAKVTAPRG